MRMRISPFDAAPRRRGSESLGSAAAPPQAAEPDASGRQTPAAAWPDAAGRGTADVLGIAIGKGKSDGHDVLQSRWLDCCTAACFPMRAAILYRSVSFLKDTERSISCQGEFGVGPKKRGLFGTECCPSERIGARQRVLEAACSLFYRKGIRAVGVEMIAEEADTTK